MTQRRTKLLSVMVTEAQHAALREAAERDARTLSSYVRKALADKVKADLSHPRFG
jgi:predicted HicB family RNase H-like nuclease